MSTVTVEGFTLPMDVVPVIDRVAYTVVVNVTDRSDPNNIVGEVVEAYETDVRSPLIEPMRPA